MINTVVYKKNPDTANITQSFNTHSFKPLIKCAIKINL